MLTKKVSNLLTVNRGGVMDPGALNSYWHSVVDLIQDGVMIVDREGMISALEKGNPL